MSHINKKEVADKIVAAVKESAFSKKILVLSIGFTLSLNIFANKQVKEPYIVHTFPASLIKEIEVITFLGSITVNGDANSSEAVVEVYISGNPNWSEEKIKQTLEENYTIDVSVKRGKLYAVVKSKRIDGLGLTVSFIISVPNQISSNLKTSLNRISISNLSGSHTLKTGNGSLTVENVSGSVVAKTSGSSVIISNANGNIDIRTHIGNITAENLNGKINLKTSGGVLTGDVDAPRYGNIKANNIRGTLKIETSGSSVELDNISGNLDAKTTDGVINVKMETVDEFVKLSNTGAISLSLPDASRGYHINAVAQRIETMGLSNFNGSREDNKIKGKVGNGGAKIELKSSREVKLVFN